MIQGPPVFIRNILNIDLGRPFRIVENDDIFESLNGRQIIRGFDLKGIRGKRMAEPGPFEFDKRPDAKFPDIFNFKERHRTISFSAIHQYIDSGNDYNYGTKQKAPGFFGIFSLLVKS